ADLTDLRPRQRKPLRRTGCSLAWQGNDPTSSVPGPRKRASSRPPGRRCRIDSPQQIPEPEDKERRSQLVARGPERDARHFRWCRGCPSVPSRRSPPIPAESATKGKSVSLTPSLRRLPVADILRCGARLALRKSAQIPRAARPPCCRKREIIVWQDQPVGGR